MIVCMCNALCFSNDIRVHIQCMYMYIYTCTCIIHIITECMANHHHTSTQYTITKSKGM